MSSRTLELANQFVRQRLLNSCGIKTAATLGGATRLDRILGPGAHDFHKDYIQQYQKGNKRVPKDSDYYDDDCGYLVVHSPEGEAQRKKTWQTAGPLVKQIFEENNLPYTVRYRPGGDVGQNQEDTWLHQIRSERDGQDAVHHINVGLDHPADLVRMAKQFADKQSAKKKRSETSFLGRLFGTNEASR